VVSTEESTEGTRFVGEKKFRRELPIGSEQKSFYGKGVKPTLILSQLTTLRVLGVWSFLKNPH